MRLFELMNAITPLHIKSSERRIDEGVCVQRVVKTAGAISTAPHDIEQQLHRARTNPNF
jgi:hypothetical protein